MFQNKVTEVSEGEEGHQSMSLWELREWRTVWRTNRISDEYSHTTMILNLFSVLLKQIKINKQTSHCYLINHWIIKGSKLNFSSVKASAVASANACFVHLKSSINPFIILSTYPKSGCDGSILSRVIPGILLPSLTFQFLLGDLKASTGQARYVISPVGSGFTPRSLPSWAFVKNL